MRVPVSTVHRTVRGFTLTELIITMVIIGVMATMTVGFITRPMQGYMDLSRRAELVDAAEMALRQVARDVRRALPNSVRVDYGGNGTCDGGDAAMEMLNTVDAAMYRAYPPPGSPDERLTFDAADTSFNTYDHFRNIEKPFSATDHFLAINTLDNSEVYQANSAVRTPAGTQIDITLDGGEDRVTMSPGFDFDAFVNDEPPEVNDSIQGRRVYLVDGPVQYRCEGGTLWRYSGYGLSATQSEPDVGGSKVADHVDCTSTRFCYEPGSAQRGALATLEIHLSDQGETVTLLHQVHVVNVP